MDMTILNHQNKRVFGREEEELLHRVVSYAGGILELGADAELSLVIMDNEGIRELNREYRGIDQATDVLSFAMRESGDEDPGFSDPSDEFMLGDIIISLERAWEQSAEYGHSPSRELAFLAVHGLLHLLGYDHMDAGSERQMLAKQDEILEGLGLTRE